MCALKVSPTVGIQSTALSIIYYDVNVLFGSHCSEHSWTLPSHFNPLKRSIFYSDVLELDDLDQNASDEEDAPSDTEQIYCHAKGLSDISGAVKTTNEDLNDNTIGIIAHSEDINDITVDVVTRVAEISFGCVTVHSELINKGHDGTVSHTEEINENTALLPFPQCEGINQDTITSPQSVIDKTLSTETSTPPCPSVLHSVLPSVDSPGEFTDVCDEASNRPS